MNIAPAGLTAREEVALGMLVGQALPGWQCLPAGLTGAPLVPADLYVVDLAGRGMARWTDTAQAELLKALDGMPAVLVAPAFDQTWSALDEGLRQSQPLVLLHKPYGIEAMRAALQQAAAGRQLPARSTTLRVVKPAVPDGARATESRAVSQSLLFVAPGQSLPPAGVPFVPAAVPATVAHRQVERTLDCSAFQARMGPLSGKPFFLRRLAESLAHPHPFELRISFVNRMIFHPAEQWVASNTPAPVLEMLCRDDTLALGVEIDPVNALDARGRAARLDLPVQPLEAMLWTLAHDFNDSMP